MASFAKILGDQKKDFGNEKKKVQISEAAQEYVLQHQIDLGYTPAALKDRGIGRGAQKIVKDFETAVFSISDASGYADFADFIRQWDTTVLESKKGKKFNTEEKQYIEDIVGSTMTQISALGGVALRSTFAYENFLKQFKPLKLAGLITQNVPIIGDMVQRRIASIEAGEEQAKRAVLEGKREEKRERLRGVEDTLTGGGVTDDFGGPATGGTGGAAGGVEELFDKPQKKADTTAAKFAKSLVGAPKVGSEESAKEADAEREESQDLFGRIAENTDSMVELLGGEGGEAKKTGGFLKSLFNGDFLKTITGGLIGGTAGGFIAKSGLAKFGAKFAKTFGSKLFLGITGVVTSLFLAIMDGIKGSKMFGGIPGFIGGFLGGTDKGIKGAFDNMGKWAIAGAVAGSFVPVIGTLIGGLIGALIGGILGFIGGERIANAVRGIGDKISAIYENLKQSFADIGEKIWGWLKDLPGRYLEMMKKVWSPVTWLIKKMVQVIKMVVNSVVDKIPDFGIDKLEKLKEKMKFDMEGETLEKPDVSLKNLENLDLKSDVGVGDNIVDSSSTKGLAIHGESSAVVAAAKDSEKIVYNNVNTPTTIQDNKSSITTIVSSKNAANADSPWINRALMMRGYR